MKKTPFRTLGRRLIPILAALPLVLPPVLPAVWGTTFYERPFPETVKEAPIVVRGRVGASSGRMVTSGDGNKRIYTYTELQLDETLKGPPIKSRSILIRELGGEVGGVGMQVSGTAQFTPGEDVVVFLSPPVHVGSPDEAYDVQGMMMGKYNLERKEDGKEHLVGAGIPASLSPAQRHQHSHGAGENEDQTVWTLDSLRELIKSQGNSEAKADNKTPVMPSTSAPVEQNPTSEPEVQPTVEAAPQLQTQVPATGASFWIYVLLTVSVVTGVAVIYALIRKFSR